MLILFANKVMKSFFSIALLQQIYTIKINHLVSQKAFIFIWFYVILAHIYYRNNKVMTAYNIKNATSALIIDNPKVQTGPRKGKDLSDHYPIVISEKNLIIVSYNLQFMHTLVSKIEGKRTSAELVSAVAELSDYFVSKNADVCCVQELFDEKANNLMEAAMLKKGYVATKRVGGSIVPYFNGGARTFIKKDLCYNLSQEQHVYHNKIDYFVGADALANKGVLHSSFKNKDGTKTHIFNTHLQAYYPNREHYAEITLAQCVELKKFIETQLAKKKIGPDDKIILCGDFNIPKPSQGEKTNFLFEKMRRILGPQFSFLEHARIPGKPKHTISLQNSYNVQLPLSSDMNVNLDMGLVFDPKIKKQAQVADLELSDIYCGLQLAISHYIRKNATLFTHYLLTENSTKQLMEFNNQSKQLMKWADRIRLEDKNPLDNEQWFAKAVELLQGPGVSSCKINTTHAQDEPPVELQAITLLPIDSKPLENLKQCQEKFDKLVYNLQQLHAKIHRDYIESPEKQKQLFAASLKLNHILLNAGDAFFKNPTPASFKVFNKTCINALNEATLEFKKHSCFWQQVNPLIKGIFGILAGIIAIPALLLIKNSSAYQYIQTFFATPKSVQLEDIKNDFEAKSTL